MEGRSRSRKSYPRAQAPLGHAFSRSSASDCRAKLAMPGGLGTCRERRPGGNWPRGPTFRIGQQIPRFPIGTPLLASVPPRDRPHGLVRSVLKADPLDGRLFLFVNRRGDRLDGLWWDHDERKPSTVPRLASGRRCGRARRGRCGSVCGSCSTALDLGETVGRRHGPVPFAFGSCESLSHHTTRWMAGQSSRELAGDRSVLAAALNRRSS